MQREEIKVLLNNKRDNHKFLFVLHLKFRWNGSRIGIFVKKALNIYRRHQQIDIGIRCLLNKCGWKKINDDTPSYCEPNVRSEQSKHMHKIARNFNHSSSYLTGRIKWPTFQKSPRAARRKKRTHTKPKNNVHVRNTKSNEVRNNFNVNLYIRNACMRGIEKF